MDLFMYFWVDLCENIYECDKKIYDQQWSKWKNKVSILENCEKKKKTILFHHYFILSHLFLCSCKIIQINKYVCVEFKMREEEFSICPDSEFPSWLGAHEK